MRRHRIQAARAIGFNIRHHGNLLRVILGQHKRPPRLLPLPSHRQRAANRAQTARQRQFARKLVTRQIVRVHLPARRQNANRNRQIKPPRLFGQIGRRKVHRDFLRGKRKAALQNRRAHTVSAFFHFSVGQPHNVKLRQAIGKMRFHLHQRRIHAAKRTAVYHGKSHIIGL